jgi:putative membrane protein
MKIAAYFGGLLGLALLTALFVREGLSTMLQALGLAGWSLLWLVPYRLLYFLIYAIGWRELLRPSDPQGRAGLGYLFWVSTVREAIDRLLPVASVGGGVAGVRLVRLRGLAAAPVAASVIVEILLTLVVLYLFTALGLLLLLQLSGTGEAYHRMVLGFVLTLPAPLITALLLRYGKVFERLQGFLRPMVGEIDLSQGAASLDHEVRATLGRHGSLLMVASLQFLAWVSGSFEIWFALRLFGHPVGVGAAIALESMTQAVRHFAFIVPAGLGVQEAGLILFGHALGIGPELALAVSVAKRMREVLCGLPPLLSWQWLEGRKLHALIAGRSGSDQTKVNRP